MTSQAVYLKQNGYDVIGSDVKDIFPTDKILRENNIIVKKGFSEKNISENYDLVIITGAHGGMTNIEAQQAKKMGIPVYMHGKYLGLLMKNKFGISISGCHGKTTTAAITAFLLTKSGLSPSYAIGTAEISGLGPAGHKGRGNIFVAEADEYMTCPQTDPTPRFLWQDPKILVITNIEYDHPDAYSDINKVKDAYVAFAEKLAADAIVIVCIDNKNVVDILPKIKQSIITYGFSPRADFQIYRFYFGENSGFMRIKHKNIDLGEYMLSVPGRHNMLNALAAMIVSDQVGVSRDNIRKNLILYTGCKRRFEKIGQFGGITLYDDYAHHPSEIAATLGAAREWFKTKRIIAIFQPHTFSRTKALLPDFAKAFTTADMALICDIYPSAREQFDSTINAQMLVMAANKIKRNAYYLKDKEQVISFLKENLREGDLVLTMGAGDIYLWHKDFKKILQEKFK